MAIDFTARQQRYLALAACIAVTWPMWSGAQPDIPTHQPTPGHESPVRPNTQPTLTVEEFREEMVQEMARQARRQDATDRQLSQLRSITHDLRRRDDQLQRSIYQLQRRIDQLSQRVTMGDVETGKSMHKARADIRHPGKADSADVTMLSVAVSELESQLNALIKQRAR